MHEVYNINHSTESCSLIPLFKGNVSIVVIKILPFFMPLKVINQKGCYSQLWPLKKKKNQLLQHKIPKVLKKGRGVSSGVIFSVYKSILFTFTCSLSKGSGIRCFVHKSCKSNLITKAIADGNKSFERESKFNCKWPQFY